MGNGEWSVVNRVMTFDKQKLTIHHSLFTTSLPAIQRKWGISS